MPTPAESLTAHLEIRRDDLSSPEVQALLVEHLRNMAEISPPESIHALDLDALRQPAVTFWTVWSSGNLVGCGALLEIDPTHGEVKSMRTAAAHRRQGVAQAMLAHLLAEARRRSYARLSLETGSAAAFEPARRLYESVGFRYCGPFADYTNDPNSVFMTLPMALPMAEVAHDPATYGDGCASFYDDLYPTVEVGLLATLVDLAGSGPVLELGVGTGRVARRLRRAGLAVHGVDASAAMIAKFRSLPGAAGAGIVRGDFAALPYRGPFKLVFALVNTLALLPSYTLLASCLAGVARVLAPDGAFLYETYPDAGAEDSAVAESHDYAIRTADGLRTYRVTTLATPAERFDEMAATAGLRPLAAWSDWRRTPATASSPRRILLYGRQGVLENTCLRDFADQTPASGR